MEQRVGEATVSGYACGHCYDTGIVTGSAELDGENIVVHKICTYCEAAKNRYVTKSSAVGMSETIALPIDGTGGGGGGIE